MSLIGQPGAQTSGDEIVWAVQANDRGEFDRPIRPNSIRPADVGVLAGAALASLALVWLLYVQLAPTSG